MLLSEQLRAVGEEEVLYTGETGEIQSNHDWGTRVTQNISLSMEKIVYLRIDVYTYNAEGAGRILVDDVPVLTVCDVHNETLKREIFLVLSAGSHTIKFQTACWFRVTTTPPGVIQLKNLKIAVLNFPDKKTQRFDSGDVNAPNNTTTTILSTQTFTPPSARKLAVGKVKKVTCIVTAYMAATHRLNYPKNVGEGNESGAFSWRIYLDGSQESWDERDDDVGDYADNPTYGEGAYGRLIKVLDPGTNYTVRVDVYNNSGSGRNCRAVVSVTMCPWIIPNEEYEPIDLDFPQGSTLYLVLEPLDQNPSKTIKIGKERFVSFGDDTDYYSKSTGIGVLSYSFTFEIVEVLECVLLISGYGGCISIVGVDVR